MFETYLDSDTSIADENLEIVGYTLIRAVFFISFT